MVQRFELEALDEEVPSIILGGANLGNDLLKLVRVWMFWDNVPEANFFVLVHIGDQILLVLLSGLQRVTPRASYLFLSDESGLQITVLFNECDDFGVICLLII